VQVLYQPPLGIFAYGEPMGAGQYKLSMAPDPSYRLSMVETKVPDYAASTGADSRYGVSIKDIKFYACVAKMSIPDSIQTLDLTEWQAQSKTMTGKSNQFQYPRALKSRIYIALQGPAAGSNPAFPPNKFIGASNSDLNIDLLQVSYGNQTKPQTRWSSEFGSGVNHLRQFYQNTICETMRMDESGGVESFNEWLERGPIYAFRFDRDANARDTEVTVQVTYKDPSGGTFDNNSKLFILSEYRKLTKISHSHGSIVEVVSMNA
jgi:hypothetical protein